MQSQDAATEWVREEVEGLRAETRGCRSDRIYLNNAGASLLPQSVVERVVTHLRREEEVGGYEAATEVLPELEAVYRSIADLIGAESEEIALQESATRAWQMAFYSLPLAEGTRILTARNEYGSNFIALLQITRRRGAKVEVIPDAASGELDLEALEKTLKSGNCGCIALTHVATNSGLVQPAAEVGRLARRYGVPFLLDACQSVGQCDVDVKEIECDMLTATGRKYLRAPRGTGFLWVRQELCQKLEPVMLEMKSAAWVSPDDYRLREGARRFENFEASIAGRLGLGVAVRYAQAIGTRRIASRVQKLASHLRDILGQIPEIVVQDRGPVRCGIVTFTHKRIAPQEVVRRLAETGILVRTSPREATLLDMDSRALSEVVRASVHYYNTDEEMERVGRAVSALE